MATGENDEDELALLRERLHVARASLRQAYDQRDALAKELAAANAVGAVSSPRLAMALVIAEHAVLAAEVEMKDAVHALAVAREPPLRNA